MASALHGTSIRSVQVSRLDIPLLSPFGISKGSLELAANVLVAVLLEDGSVGHGEAAPFPAYNAETQSDALALLERAARRLPGEDAASWEEAGARLRADADRPWGAARCALETALLDAVCRSRGVSLWSHFGGAGTELRTDMTVTTGSAAQAGADARGLRARGIAAIKAKIGGRAVREDLDRIAAIAAAAPGASLILDGNAGLTRETSAELADGLRAIGIAPLLLEQWLPREDLEGMRALRGSTGWPVAADEAVASADDALRVASAGAADVINVKLMKAGVAEALKIAAAARSAGIGLMIGGNIESLLAMTASACFAAGLGGFGFADLDTPLFMAENPFEGGYRLEGDRVSVAHIRAGHGVAPRGLLL